MLRQPREVTLANRRQAAEPVAQILHEGEQTIDLAIEKIAGLITAITTFNRETNISGLVGRGAVIKGISAIKALGDAREEILDAHLDLSEAQRQVGLGAVAIGFPEKPDDKKIGAQADLKAVRSAA